MSKGILLLCFTAAVCVKTVQSVCGTCGTQSGVMCHTVNTFSVCNNGAVGNVINVCPANNVCRDVSQVCGPPSATFVADCPAPAPMCGTCSTDLRFACVNSTTFAFCFGTMNASQTYGNCPAGQFCDTTVAAPEFCSTNAGATCMTTTTMTPPTTTTAAPSNYCQQLNARDRTRYASPFNSQCMQYVYCFRNNGVLNGQYYFCPGTTLFNNQTGLCVPPSNFTCPPFTG